jgi:hypothetical protein
LDELNKARAWLWVPAVIVFIVVASSLFATLDGLTTPHVAVAEPVFVVNKVEKVFVPPPASARRVATLPLAPAVITPRAPSFPSLELISEPPFAPPPAWRVADEGKGIERSLDGGSSWRAIALPSELTGAITSLAVTRNQIAVETSTGQHWVSADAGARWTRD